MVVPPKDGYGKKGNPQAGIKGTDSLVFVVDVIASLPQVRHRAEEHRRPPASPTDLPTVTGEPGAEPTITVPTGTTPPKEPDGHRPGQGHRPGGGQGQARRS